MGKKEQSLQALSKFIPQGSFMLVLPFFDTHTIHLTLTRERKSVLGDYRNPTKDAPFHRISINANLNQYNFLITLLHELAHLFAWVKYQGRVAPHGNEWKNEFRKILVPFLGKSIFPIDIEKALLSYLHNPAASTCTDIHLYKALYRYDERKPGYKLVDDLGANAVFETENGERYQIMEKRRTRTKCRNVSNGRLYLFSGIVEVKEIKPDNNRLS